MQAKVVQMARCFSDKSIVKGRFQDDGIATSEGV